MQKQSKESTSSLGIAQLNLENATRILKTTQKAFDVASQRLDAAEEEHLRATEALIAEVGTVRGRNRVTPQSLR
jgi:hypothetical protein